MPGAFSEFGADLRRERLAEGAAAAKRRGTRKSRNPKIDMEKTRRPCCKEC